MLRCSKCGSDDLQYDKLTGLVWCDDCDASWPGFEELEAECASQ